MNPLAGKPLRYLIGADELPWVEPGCLTMMPYGHPPIRGGLCAGYCNLFDENNTGKYGPYLKTSDTAEQYNEGQIDPRGPGWNKNLIEQFEQRKRQGFEYIELDNPDAYSIDDVIGAIDLAASYGLKVIAKNPGLMGLAATKYISHPNVYGTIVEKSDISAVSMDELRRQAGKKPDLPVWFVAFGSGRSWANRIAGDARYLTNMGVTYSSGGEYTDSTDILKPKEKENGNVMPTFEALKSEYETLWATMQVRPERATAVDAIVRKLRASENRYRSVAEWTGVPWPVIAAWHNRESDADFNKQLAQGDPLNRPSVNEPAGRGPFDDWEESAVDALVTLKHLNEVPTWTGARICYETERYNGFGYRNHHPNVLSPYLWSFTNHYSVGKYVADGEFSSSAVDKQCGAIPIIKELMAAERPVVAKPAKPAAPVASTQRSWLSALFEAIIGLFSHSPAEPKVSVEPLDLAGRIVAAMRKRGYRLDIGPGEMNTVYVEGVGPEGGKNSNSPNEFNDGRFVITFENGKPKLAGAWQATTEPSKYWTENRMNEAGAARIKFGQYTAWQVGTHNNSHEALVQTGGKVTVYRDDNEDFERDGDNEDAGYFGINQHWGYDLPKNDLGRSSAGCLVGRMKKGHQEFMTLMKSDPRYQVNRKFVFTATILPSSEV